MNVQWFLVADAGGAKILAPRDGVKTFSVVRDMPNPDGRRRDQELAGDKSGRIDKGGRHIFSAMDPVLSPHQREARRFADVLVRVLDQEAMRDKYDSLTVIAPPKFMGILISSFSSRVRGKIVSRIAKDFAHLDLPRLAKELHKLAGFVPVQ